LLVPHRASRHHATCRMSLRRRQSQRRLHRQSRRLRQTHPRRQSHHRLPTQRCGRRLMPRQSRLHRQSCRRPHRQCRRLHQCRRQSHRLSPSSRLPSWRAATCPTTIRPRRLVSRPPLPARRASPYPQLAWTSVFMIVSLSSRRLPCPPHRLRAVWVRLRQACSRAPALCRPPSAAQAWSVSLSKRSKRLR